MSSRHLREFFTETPQSVLQSWHKERLTRANRALMRAYHMSSCSNRALIGPDAAMEVLGETVARIGADWKGYIWTGEGEFDLFFDACMAKTVHFVHSQTRPDRQRLVSMDMEDLLKAANNHPTEPTQEQDTSRSLYRKTLATIMAKSHLQQNGSVEQYLLNLERYANSHISPEDICTEIGISKNSLGSTRARARKTWNDPEKE